MERHQFNVSVNAPREKVWEALWNENNYRTWTAAFAPDSQVVTNNYEKGSKILFTDGKGSGMVAVVDDHIPNEYMAFKHIGEVKDGVEDTTSDRVKDWAGAMETYTLKPSGNGTDVLVEMDISDNYKDYFMETWPKALEKVKEIAESN